MTASIIALLLMASDMASPQISVLTFSWCLREMCRTVIEAMPGASFSDCEERRKAIEVVNDIQALPFTVTNAKCWHKPGDQDA